jgi:hypothetical protein
MISKWTSGHAGAGRERMAALSSGPLAAGECQKRLIFLHWQRGGGYEGLSAVE